MKGFNFRVSAALLVFGSCFASARSQALLAAADLPDEPAQAIGTAAQVPPDGPGRIDGVVVDVEGNPVPNAKVLLTARGVFNERTVQTAADGSYSFIGVPIEPVRVDIVAPGFDEVVSAEFRLTPTGTTTAPKISLKVSANSTSVDVSANPAQIATAEVELQEKQRVFGVFQNFYTSYIWKAEPMPTRLKYKLAFRTVFDPTTFVILAGVAGAEQINGTYPGYGPGIEGYGKRYGAALADSSSTRLIGSALLPALLHQDPRYFYQGSGSIFSRSRHAVASGFITRSDKGNTQLNYSHLIGSLASGALASTYHPDGSRGVKLTFEVFGVNLLTTSVGNLFREFVLRYTEPTVPGFANGKHVATTP